MILLWIVLTNVTLATLILAGVKLRELFADRPVDDGLDAELGEVPADRLPNIPPSAFVRADRIGLPNVHGPQPSHGRRKEVRRRGGRPR